MNKRVVAFFLVLGLMLQLVSSPAAAAEGDLKVFIEDRCTMDFNDFGYRDGVKLDPQNVSTVWDEANACYRFTTVNWGTEPLYKPGIMTKQFSPSQPYTGGPVEISMQVKVNDLPVITGNHTVRGFGVDFRGTPTAGVAPYMKVMLSATPEGKIVFYVANTSGGGNGVRVDSDYRLADKPTLDVQLTKSSKNKMTLTVNGEMLRGDIDASAATVTNSSKTTLDLFNAYYNVMPGYGILDVELYGIKVAEIPPEPEVGRRIALNAYMANPAPTIDGILSDRGYNFLGHMTYMDGIEAPKNAITAVQWDRDYLYFGVRYTGTATKFEAAIGAETVVYDIAENRFGSVPDAFAAAMPGAVELKIPLAAFGISDISFNHILQL